MFFFILWCFSLSTYLVIYLSALLYFHYSTNICIIPFICLLNRSEISMLNFFFVSFKHLSICQSFCLLIETCYNPRLQLSIPTSSVCTGKVNAFFFKHVSKAVSNTHILWSLLFRSDINRSFICDRINVRDCKANKLYMAFYTCIFIYKTASTKI